MDDHQAVAVVSGLHATVILLWLAAVLILAYWLSYFSDGAVQASGELCYHVFERNFPLPDGFVALSAVLAAVHLRRRRTLGMLWALLCAGGFYFLGLIDISYNLWNGMYAQHTPEMAVEALINLACLALASWLVLFCWRQRRLLVLER